MWATLPCDLLLDISRRLGSTAVIRSTGVCRPWRRAIIDNASCLWPRPDRFLPDLLLAMLDTYRRRRVRQGRVEYVSAAGPLEKAIALDDVDVSDNRLRLLTSRDGFLLFWADSAANNNLCLCNPHAGSCRLLSAGTLCASSGGRCTYILATGGAAVRILAVAMQENIKDGMTYQVFSSTSGAWGPVKRSAKINEYWMRTYILAHEAKDVVVCDGGSVVYWLGIKGTEDRGVRRCLFAIDLCTEQTWTTDLPKQCHRSHCSPSALLLATSEDGRLSLVALGEDRRRMEVWVLVDDNLWTLQRTLDARSMFPNCLSLRFIRLSGFCPRSGCLFGFGRDNRDLLHHFLVGIDGSSPRLTDAKFCYSKLPYEMGWST